MGHRLVGKEKRLLQITDVAIVVGPVSLCQLIPAPGGGIYPANDVNSLDGWWQLWTTYDRNKALRYRNCWTSVDMNDMTFSLPVMMSSKTHGHLQADRMIFRPTIEPQLDYHLINKFCGDSTKLPQNFFPVLYPLPALIYTPPLNPIAYVSEDRPIGGHCGTCRSEALAPQLAPPWIKE